MFWQSQPLHTVMNMFGCTVALGLSQHESGVTDASQHCLQSLFPASLAVFSHCWSAYMSGVLLIEMELNHLPCTACSVTRLIFY